MRVPRRNGKPGRQTTDKVLNKIFLKLQIDRERDIHLIENYICILYAPICATLLFYVDLAFPAYLWVLRIYYIQKFSKTYGGDRPPPPPPPASAPA